MQAAVSRILTVGPSRAAAALFAAPGPLCGRRRPWLRRRLLLLVLQSLPSLQSLLPVHLLILLLVVVLLWLLILLQILLLRLLVLLLLRWAGRGRGPPIS